MSTLKFNYEGHDFSVYLVPYQEKAEERKKIQQNLERSFDKYRETLALDRLKKNQSINWKPFLHNEHGKERREMFNLLEALSVFSLERIGNWEIISDNLSLNPRHDTDALFHFTDKKHAMAYAALEYANTQYPWCIVRYTEIVSRAEALRHG